MTRSGMVPAGGAGALGAALLALALILPPAAQAGAPCTPASPDSTDVPKAIPSPPGVAESTIGIGAPGPVNDLDVRLSITHPFDSDLTIELVPPAGEPITLAEAVGTWGDDFTDTTLDDEAQTSIISELPPFTGSFEPAEPLRALEGIDRAGTWRLRVTDRHSGYDGTITGWGLEITCPDVTAPTGAAITAPAKPFQKRPSIAVAWAAGADAGGVAAREVDYFEAPPAAGFGAPVGLSDGTATTATLTGAEPGSAYCFTARLRDSAGNASAWSEQRCTALPLDDEALTPSPEWAQQVDPGHYGGDAWRTKAKGATLTATGLTGDRFAVVATKCRSCGRLKAFLDETLLAKVSLEASKTRHRRVIPLGTTPGLVRDGEIELRVASKGRQVLVEGLGVTREPIPGLPELWDEAGAEGPPPPLPTGVPAGAEEVIGTLLTVTTTSDVQDGDTASPAALEANPGPDGAISLSEAIRVSNNAAGALTVHFDPALGGATITIGPQELPPIIGDGLLIDGDIDADGRPDVTIADGANLGFGLIVEGGGNRLHALAIEGFSVVGVGIRPPPTSGHILPGTTMTGLRVEDDPLDGASAGIALTGGYPPDVDTDIHWVDTRVVGNIVEAESDGITHDLALSTGNSSERSTFAGNRITVDADSSTVSQFGIIIGSGLWANSRGNLISDALIAHNSIAGTPESAIWLNSGGSGGPGAAGSVLEDVRVLGNRAELAPEDLAGGYGTLGISVLSADDYDPAENNTTRRIEVRGNVIDGYGREGIRVIASCCGATGNRIEDVLIADNVIEGVLKPIPGVHDNLSRGIAILGGHGTTNGGEPPATGNRIAGVAVRDNSVTIANESPFPVAELTSGGIHVVGGESGDANTVERLEIESNRIAADVAGVNVYGGFSGFPTGQDAIGDVVDDVRVAGNLVVRPPTLTSGNVPAMKGISVIGGTGWIDPIFGPWNATGNSVRCVPIDGNVVAGYLDDYFLADNLGAGASGNSATLGGC